MFIVVLGNILLDIVDTSQVKIIMRVDFEQW